MNINIKNIFLVGVVIVAAFNIIGCANVDPTNKASIDEKYQTTWTAAEDTTAKSNDEFSLTISKDQLTFISADPKSDVTTYVVMDYTVVDTIDQVYHLTLSNPVGRVVDVKDQAGETIDANTIANTVWQQYQDMYINVADTSSISIYAAGHEASPIVLFQK